MNYLEWSEQYFEDARRVLKVIERKKLLLKNASCDEKKVINDEIMKYRYIYYDLMNSGETLRKRGQKYPKSDIEASKITVSDGETLTSPEAALGVPPEERADAA